MDSPSVPTDRRLLREIYERYYQQFVSFKRGDGTRNAKVYVPIDIAVRFRLCKVESSSDLAVSGSR